MADLLVICAVTEHMRTRLAHHFDAVMLDELADPKSWLASHGSHVRYVLTDGHLGVRPDIFSALPQLALISSNGVGYDAIDTAAATARGVPVCHTPDVLNEEVATTALMLYLACWRNLEAEICNARTGAWEKTGNLPLARSADNRRVGILGLGRIGKAVARKLLPFNVTLHYCGRNRQDVPYVYHGSLIEMAAACETVISILPGGAATHHMIDREVIEAIGPEGFLINIGRGSVVDEPALIAALQDGRIGGAGLDVFEDEPRIPATLRALPNVVLTPHIGSATVETRRAMGDLAIDNLIAHKEGRPLLSPVPESRSLL